ncbi:MAG: archaeosortase/exosortase family protein [Flavobacteriales bacterium]|nr:archaeosortase/exosortase family protein [Flavobacteriales bacterium]
MEKHFTNLLTNFFNDGHLIYNKHKKVFVFLFRMAGLVLLWKIVFHVIWRFQILLDLYNEISLQIINFILKNCALLLRGFRYSVEIDGPERILRISETIGVTVGEPCIGYEVTGVFMALIISYQAPLLKKLWFIPVGASLIYILNLIRISTLAILVKYNALIWDVNHKLIFTLIIYGFIFFMWKIWIKNADEIPE